MTKAWIEKNLEAVRHLRSTYRLALEIMRKKGLRLSRENIVCLTLALCKRRRLKGYTSRDCPLCAVDRSFCRECPWTLFEGDTCVVKSYRCDSFLKRINRLNEWEHKLLKMRRTHDQSVD